MTVDHRQHHLDTLRAALGVMVYPLQFVVDLPRTTGAWVQQTFSSRRALLEENTSLQAQNLILQAQLQKLTTLELENIRLRELLGSSYKVDEGVIVAEIMSVDMDPYNHQVIINKGKIHGAYVGQPLLDATGVMGQVVHVGPITSTAMLITDPSHAIPVQVNRNGLRSIAVGTGSINELQLPHVPHNTDIRAGDQLVTSGLGGRFPPGYPVAVVTAVQYDPGRPFARVSATPVSHLDRGREILLVRPIKSAADADPSQ